MVYRLTPRSTILTRNTPSLLQKMSTPTTIVIFDGVCTLCNGAVDFLISRDRNHRMRFGSFQQPCVGAMLRERGIIEPPTTIYVITSTNELLCESAAILHLGIVLGGWWKFLSAIARVIPKPIRDSVYRIIARNRYRWFGKKDSCRIPTPQERARFIEG